MKRSGIIWENHEGDLIEDIWFGRPSPYTPSCFSCFYDFHKNARWAGKRDRVRRCTRRGKERRGAGAGAPLTRKRLAIKSGWRTRSAGRPTEVGGNGAQPTDNDPRVLTQEMVRAPGEAEDVIFDCTERKPISCSIEAREHKTQRLGRACLSLLEAFPRPKKTSRAVKGASRKPWAAPKSFDSPSFGENRWCWVRKANGFVRSNPSRVVVGTTASLSESGSKRTPQGRRRRRRCGRRRHRRRRRFEDVWLEPKSRPNLGSNLAPSSYAWMMATTTAGSNRERCQKRARARGKGRRGPAPLGGTQGSDQRNISA